ncbi:hypothetical protein NLJ89_g4708 [Agrocybe chaxingu]|uniref:Enoyl reductase (ER) domain-containing protein n=1 Tax=Agrocybe chaxingu TaxID=84603 RepID=A0A9W8K2E3_9AGAR|nr:hypothetical protein NLJ89_g4708 [Agrocybe chaxingu]
MASHKALYLDSKCGKFVLGENKTPSPGPGDLFVRIESVGLNPVDWVIQKYGLFIENFPAIIGTDIAGVVEAVGEGVTGFKKGDRVFYQGSWSNERAGYQQYNIITAETVSKIPAHLSFDDVATIPVCMTAAFLGYFNDKPHGAAWTAPLDASARNKYAGKPLVVIGGGTTVGQFAIQVGKLAGFGPIITTSSLKHAEFLKSLGATHVIDRNIPIASLGDEVKNITTKPLEIIYDAVSLPDTQKVAHDLLVPGGDLVVVMNPEITPTDGKSVMFVFAMAVLPHNRKLCIEMYTRLTQWLQEGVIKPARVEVLPGGLAAVTGGLSRLENGQVSGRKLIIHPQETA